MIFHCMYVAHFLYLFICQWTSRLLPFLDYSEKCCNKYRSANISNLGDIMLSEGSQSQKDKYCISSYIRHLNSQTHRCRKSNGGCRGREVGGLGSCCSTDTFTAMQDVKSLGIHTTLCL